MLSLFSLLVRSFVNTKSRIKSISNKNHLHHDNGIAITKPFCTYFLLVLSLPSNAFSIVRTKYFLVANTRIFFGAFFWYISLLLYLQYCYLPSEPILMISLLWFFSSKWNIILGCESRSYVAKRLRSHWLQLDALCVSFVRSTIYHETLLVPFLQILPRLSNLIPANLNNHFEHIGFLDICVATTKHALNK